jgi:dipeptidyl-peptidase-4
MIQDRIQTWCELCEVDPTTGKLTRWLREESKTWTNRPDVPRWLPDGTFLWLSERTGYQHVYHYERGGKLLGAVTSGEWQVRNLERIDTKRQVLWFEGSKDGACGRHLYRIGMDGKDLVCVTPGPGTHQAELNEDGSLVLDRWSATDQPPAVRVVDGATGKVLHEVGQAESAASAKFAFAPKLFVSIPARDGYALDATVQRPLDWAEGKRFPVYLDTYSGPDAPTVRDAWSHSAMHQFLAGQGFLVLQVNVRSASNRGQVHTGTCYRQLGVQELKDLEDAVDFVCKEHGGDEKRVAISGWSFGGFITAYALTHSTKFALGFAGAGVYDWRLYDSIYTERYMGLPDENKAGYDATSVIKAAKDLKGHLVLMHGTMDDNVHVQNTIQLLWELEKANKQNFELMLYPRSQHGLSPEVGLHQHTFQWRVLRRLQDPAWKPD